MKSLIAGIITALLLIAPQTQAQELTTTPIPVLYFNLPFGGANKAESTASYGLQLTQGSINEQGNVSLFNQPRPALLDLQMQGAELSKVSVNGLNTLSKTRVVYADGASGTESQINWNLVVPAAVVGGVILYKIAEDDDASAQNTGCTESCGGGV